MISFIPSRTNDYRPGKHMKLNFDLYLKYRNIMTNQLKGKTNLISLSCIRRYLIILLPISLILSVSDVRGAVNLQWTHNPQGGFVDTSPAVGDLDGDGVKELVFCTVYGRVFALNSRGLQVWYHDVKEPISTPPVIADLKKDGSPEVLVLTNNGNIICLKGSSGDLIWNYQLPSQVLGGTTSLAVSDLNNNGVKAIIAADNGGNLFCLKGDGTVLWSKKLEDKFNSAPAIGLLSVNGEQNILIGSDRSPLICFSASGKELWRVHGEESSGSGPLICDLNNDHSPEILVGAGKQLIAYSPGGEKLWSYKTRGNIHDGISFGDLDGDHISEVIVADLAGDVVALDNYGRALWNQNVVQRVRRSATIADIDGDFKPEVLVAGYSAVLFVYNADGSLKDQIPLKGAMNGSPTVVDFKNDGNLSIVCGTISALMAFNWTNQHLNSNPLVSFGEYRCNSVRTGSKISGITENAEIKMDVDWGNVYVGENFFRVTIKNPHKKQLKLTLKITQKQLENDKVFNSFDTLFSEEIRYNVDGRNASDLGLSAKLSENGKIVIQKENSFYVVPWAKDMADLKDKLAKIKAINSDFPDLNQYVNEQLIVYSYRLHEIEEKTKVAGTLSIMELSELKNSVSSIRKEITGFYKMSLAGRNSKSGFEAYLANPWAPFGGVDEIIENRLQKGKITIEAFKGETESAAINIANFLNKSQTLRIETLALISEKDSSEILAKEVIELHEVLNVPTQSSDYSGDALPLLNQAQTMLIPQRDVRQLWINVNTKKLSPGKWKGTIRISSLNIDSKYVDIPVSIEVWETGLPEKQPVRLCLWGYVESSRLKDFPEEAFQDNVTHGTNVFVAPGEFAPKANFDNQGNIIGEIDYGRHDIYVKKHAGDAMVLFFNYQGGLKGPAEQLTPVWLKAYKIWVQAWIGHLKAMGVTYDQFAFYPVDEPGLSNGLVDLFITLAKAIREVDPQALIYTDPVGLATMEELKRMSPYVDIWCPNRSGYLLKEGQDKLAYLKSTGETVWTYECAGNAKHQSPLGYYRSQAWLISHYGLTGMGFWSYCTSSADPWFTPEGTQDYLLIYQGNGVVSSKRWEAIRDGIEDYGLLNELKKGVIRSKDNSTATIVKEANKLLETEAFDIARYCGLDEYGTEPGLGGMHKLREIEDARWDKIQKVRRKIAGLLLELK